MLIPASSAISCTPVTPKRITDQALLENVTDILNAIINEPSLLELPSPHRENYSLDVARTENQINRELEKSEVDSDYTKLLIFGCAAAKYEACADTEPEYLTLRLLAIFGGAAAAGCLFNSIV
jgi:hypothetical protein